VLLLQRPLSISILLQLDIHHQLRINLNNSDSRPHHHSSISRWPSHLLSTAATLISNEEVEEGPETAGTETTGTINNRSSRRRNAFKDNNNNPTRVANSNNNIHHINNAIHVAVVAIGPISNVSNKTAILSEAVPVLLEALVAAASSTVNHALSKREMKAAVLKLAVVVAFGIRTDVNQTGISSNHIRTDVSTRTDRIGSILEDRQIRAGFRTR
jgi:hypothetical protein